MFLTLSWSTYDRLADPTCCEKYLKDNKHKSLQNRSCPQTNIQAYFHTKCKLLFIFSNGMNLNWQEYFLSQRHEIFILRVHARVFRRVNAIISKDILKISKGVPKSSKENENTTPSPVHTLPPKIGGFRDNTIIHMDFSFVALMVQVYFTLTIHFSKMYQLRL